MQALYHKVKRQNEKNRRIPNFVSFRDRLGIFPGRKGCYDGLVEASARHAETIRTNLAAVCHAIAARGREPGVAKVLVAEVEKIPEILSPEYFAFILADPPYHPAAGEYGARELLLDERWTAFADAGTLLALEHASDVLDLPWAPRSPWRLVRKRVFGIRSVSYARLAAVSSFTDSEEFV